MNLFDLEKCFFFVHASDNNASLIIEVENNIEFWQKI